MLPGRQVRMATRWGGSDQVQLRDVTLGDVDVYVRMRCDPEMMAELGGPLPRDGIAAKVRKDVEDTAADRAWVLMIVGSRACVPWRYQPRVKRHLPITRVHPGRPRGRGVQ